MLESLIRDLEDVRGNAEKIEHGAIGIQQIISRIIVDIETLNKCGKGKEE